MRYLITGGAGFIGSHLAEALLGRGDEVLLLDDLSTGSIENIRHFKSNPLLQYWLDTVMNKHLLAELVDECDVVFNLAAAVGVRRIIDSPVRTIETNIEGTAAVLEAAEKKRKLVVVASTSEVYGKNAKVPFCEDDDLVLGSTSKSRWSYAASKAVDEFLALAYFREKKLPVIVCRFFNTVGPRQTGRYGMVLPTFVNQALANEPISVFGSGEQSRCFSSVKDVVVALMKLVDTPAAVGEVVNIGSTEEITITDLAKRVKTATKSDSPIQYVPYDQAYEEGFEDMLRRVPSLEKLERLIGYRPRTTLDQIIADVVSHYADAARSRRVKPATAGV